MVDYTAIEDIGNVINHTLAAGQLHGGVVQGAGQVFGENCLYDAENGQLIAGSFMDYVMPRADLIPSSRAARSWRAISGQQIGSQGCRRSGNDGRRRRLHERRRQCACLGRRRSFRHAGNACAHLEGAARIRHLASENAWDEAAGAQPVRRDA